LSILEALINSDPTTIIVTRHVQMPSAGGYSWVETDLPPQTVRLYNISPRNQSQMTLPEGDIRNITLGIVATASGDFGVSHGSYDTFLHQGRTYRVVGVRHYDDLTIEEHIQADCVAV